MAMLQQQFVDNTSIFDSPEKTFTVKDGLPGWIIYDVIIDHEGFLWLATDGGISRFDGQSFHELQDLNAEIKEEIVLLFEDSNGRVWLSGYEGGLYYVKDDQLHKADFEDNESPKLNRHCWDIIEDSNGTVWFGTFDNGLLSFDGNSLRTHSEGFSVYELWKESDQVFALVNNFEIVSLQEISKPSFQPSIMTPPVGIASIPSAVLPTRSGLLIQRNEGIEFKQFGVKIINQLISKIPDDTRALSAFENRSYWATSEGVFSIDIGSKTMHMVSQVKDASCIAEDAQGGIWIGTQGGGLTYVPGNRLQILNHRNIHNGRFTAIHRNQNKLWLGTNDGTIYILNQRSQIDSLTILRKRFNRIRHIASQADSIVVESDQSIATIGSSIYVSSFHSKSFIWNDNHFYLAGVYGFVDMLTDLAESHFFKVQNSRTFDLDEYFESLDEAFKTEHLNHRISLDRSYHLLPLGSESVLVAGKDSVSIYNERSRSLTKIQDGNLSAVFTDQEHSFDLVDYRLYEISSNGFYKKVITAPISPSLDIRALEYDSTNATFWLATQKGVLQLQENNPDVSIFIDYHDGLPSNDIQDIHLNKDTLWVAGLGGVAYIPEPLKHISPPLNSPSVQGYFNDGTSRSSFSSGDQLEHFQNAIEFDVSISTLLSGPNRRFEIQLFPVELEPHQSQSTKLRYAGLAANKYTLSVSVIDKYGTVRKAEDFNFEIQAVIWKRTSFLTIATLVVFSLLIGFFRYRNYLKHQEYQWKLKSSEHQLQALRAQIKPHLIFNVLNSIRLLFLKGENQSGVQYVTRFSRLFRYLLDHSRSDFVGLDEELKFIKTYLDLEKLRLKQRLTYSIETTINRPEEDLFIPSLITQPLIENALWHGINRLDKGTLLVSYSELKDSLVVTIADNGNGFDVNNIPKDSRGLQLIKDRIEILNGRLQDKISFVVQSQLPSKNESGGTLITIIIPQKEIIHGSL